MQSIDEKARSLFLSALERGTGEWREYLEEVCGGDTELRDRVDQLLKAHQAMGSIRVGAGETPDPTGDHTRAEPLGTQIGPYKLVELIGEGGMGAVYLAQQIEPVKRMVALKVIKAGMDSKQVLARFEAERQALALMDHPNIAKVLDAGTISVGWVESSRPTISGGAKQVGLEDSTHPTRSDGRPYFVMELVKGVSIIKFCDERRLTPRERLELFLPVCHAIQHAHQKGIIHRDIKPNNVLVALYDGKPVPKVIDFGVAKAAGQPLTERTLVTGLGAVVGTPEYMSPEQAELNQLDIDTRSDVYSLGVLLYELLTGTTPLTRKRVKEAALLEVLRVIREEEPQKPSTRLSTTEELPSIAANRGTEPARLSRLMRGELDWIVMKALEKDRSRRYETANSFAMDLQRYLAGEAVLAVPPSAGYRLRKFARRYRKGLATAGAFGLLLMAATISSLALASWAFAERTHADEQKQSAEANFKRALEAVEQMLTRVGEDKLANVPQMESVRRDLLQDALKFYQEFLRERGLDPVVRVEAAKAYRRVGQIQNLLGHRAQAEAAYMQAVTLLDQLVAESPGDPSFLSELADVHRGLGLLYHANKRWPQAEASLKQAVELRVQVERAHPTLVKNRFALANGHSDLLFLGRQMGHLDKSETAFHNCKAILESLLAVDPTNVEYLSVLARNYQNVGLVYNAQARNAEAEAAYQIALGRIRQLVRDHPDVVEYRRQLAGTLNNLGLLYARQGQQEKARAAYEESLAYKEEIHRDNPKIVTYIVDLASSYGNMATYVRRTRTPEEALEWSEKILRLLEPVLMKDPQYVEARMVLFDTYMGRAYSLRRLGRAEEADAWRRVIEVSEGQPHINMRLYRPFAFVSLRDHARAAAEIETLVVEGHTQGGNLLMFAEAHGLCAVAAANDAHRPLPERAQLAGKYGRRAVELLRQAQAAGYFKDPARVAQLKENKDIVPISSRPDFQALLFELEKK